jgi:hypothetical protein
MFQVRRMSSVAAVATQDAIDHGTDNGNAIAGASTIAVAITRAAVIDRAIIIDDRAIIIDRSAAVVAAAVAATVVTAARSDDNTAATGVAGRSISATGGAGHRASAAATSGKGLSAAAATVSGHRVSAAAMTIILMAGSRRSRRHRHATQRDRGCESDKSFFVKHVILP